MFVWFTVKMQLHVILNLCNVLRLDMRRSITVKIRSWSRTCRQPYHVLKKHLCCSLKRLICCELILTQLLHARNSSRALEVSYSEFYICHLTV